LRGEPHCCRHQLLDEPAEVKDAARGEIRISTVVRARAGEHVSGSLRLAPWEAAIGWRDA